VAQLAGGRDGGAAQARRGVLTVTVFALLAGYLANAPDGRATFPGPSGELMFVGTDISGKVLYTSTALTGYEVPSNKRRTAAYCAWDNSNPDCLFRDAASNADGTRIATIRDEWTASTLEPTARRIAVLDPAGTEVASVPLENKPTFDPSWSPTGDRLSVTRYPSANGSWPAGNPQVSIVTFDGTEVATFPGGSDADWSPNGEIAFVRDGEIWLTTVPGEPRRLTIGGASTPSWSPDGRRVAFVRQERVWSIGADGRDPAPIGTLSARDVVWSPDGRLLAVTRPESSTAAGNIWLMAVDGRCPRPVTRTDGFYYSHSRPFWRPLTAGRPVGPCAHLRPDFSSTRTRAAGVRRALRYRFKTWPGKWGQVKLRTRAKVVVPGQPGAGKRRVSVATERFTANNRGIVNVRIRLTTVGRKLLRSAGSLNTIAVVTVRDGPETASVTATARKSLTLVAPRARRR
jgi:hypothetical protein